MFANELCLSHITEMLKMTPRRNWKKKIVVFFTASWICSFTVSPLFSRQFSICRCPFHGHSCIVPVWWPREVQFCLLCPHSCRAGRHSLLLRQFAPVFYIIPNTSHSHCKHVRIKLWVDKPLPSLSEKTFIINVCRYELSLTPEHVDNGQDAFG